MLTCVFACAGICLCLSLCICVAHRQNFKYVLLPQGPGSRAPCSSSCCSLWSRPSLLTPQYGLEKPSFWVLRLLLREVSLGEDLLVACGFLSSAGWLCFSVLVSAPCLPVPTHPLLLPITSLWGAPLSQSASPFPKLFCHSLRHPGHQRMPTAAPMGGVKRSWQLSFYRGSEPGVPGAALHWGWGCVWLCP